MGKVAELTSELEQYRQTCTDWNTWAEVRNTEYQQLLEAYNGYVEAYNNLQAEGKQPAEVASEEVDALRAELAAKTEELQQLTDSLDKSQEAQEDLEKELAELQDQRDSELSDLRSRLAVFTSSGSESSEGETMLEVAAL